jgi:hypothetical protein
VFRPFVPHFAFFISIEFSLYARYGQGLVDSRFVFAKSSWAEVGSRIRPLVFVIVSAVLRLGRLRFFNKYVIMATAAQSYVPVPDGVPVNNLSVEVALSDCCLHVFGRCSCSGVAQAGGIASRAAQSVQVVQAARAGVAMVTSTVGDIHEGLGEVFEALDPLTGPLTDLLSESNFMSGIMADAAETLLSISGHLPLAGPICHALIGFIRLVRVRLPAYSVACSREL